MTVRTLWRRPSSSAPLPSGSGRTARPCGRPWKTGRSTPWPPTTAPSPPPRSGRDGTISPRFPAACPAWSTGGCCCIPTAWRRAASPLRTCAGCCARIRRSSMAAGPGRAWSPPAATRTSWSTTPAAREPLPPQTRCRT